MKIWQSPAKLNLFLYITGKRADNYHNLQTLFQFVDLCDELQFSRRQDNRITLATPIKDIDDNNNLVIKASKLLLEYAHTHHLTLPEQYGITIHINKKLPIGGGLGGGSSNAATTLVALNELWQLHLSVNQLMTLGKTLGADVPIFIYGHSAFAQGIGDLLKSVEIPEKWFLIIKPNIEISTVSIFKHPELKRDTVTRDIDQLLNNSFENDCEPIVRKLYPIIDRIITLLSTKAPTRLTGTGSCIFCECESLQHAQKLQLFLNNQFLPTDNITSLLAKGCNKSPLYQ